MSTATAVNPLATPTSGNLPVQTNNGSMAGREVQFLPFGQYDHERLEHNMLNGNRSWQNTAAHVGAYIAEGLTLGAITLTFTVLNGVAFLTPIIFVATIPLTLITSPLMYRMYISVFDKLHAHIDRNVK